MYYLTHVTPQGVFIVALLTITLLGLWWADKD
jgi:hypothetical protein